MSYCSTEPQVTLSSSWYRFGHPSVRSSLAASKIQQIHRINVFFFFFISLTRWTSLKTVTLKISAIYAQIEREPPNGRVKNGWTDLDRWGLESLLQAEPNAPRGLAGRGFGESVLTTGTPTMRGAGGDMFEWLKLQVTCRVCDQPDWFQDSTVDSIGAHSKKKGGGEYNM